MTLTLTFMTKYLTLTNQIPTWTFKPGLNPQIDL